MSAKWRVVGLVAAGVLATAGGASAGPPQAAVDVIPKPASVQRGQASFDLAPDTRIVVPRGSGEASPVARGLARLLRRSTGYRLPVVSDSSGPRRSCWRCRALTPRARRPTACAWRAGS